jgi:hypothetical protein
MSDREKFSEWWALYMAPMPEPATASELLDLYVTGVVSGADGALWYSVLKGDELDG